MTAVPYLLGFRPDEGSVVVIATRQRRVIFAARGDLPALDAPTADLLDLAANLVPVVERQQPITHLMIVGYGEPGHVDPALRILNEAFANRGITILDLLRVTGTRIFSLRCDDPACCPPQGTPFDPTASLVAVRATAAGLVALPDRAAVAARFAPVDGTVRDRMREATAAALTRLTTLQAAGNKEADEAGAQAVRDALRQHDGGKLLTDDEVAWLTVLLQRTAVRDRAVELTQPHDGHVTFWAEVTRRAEEPLVAAPAAVLAVTAWRCGDGALAGMAAERALQADPACRLAHLMLQALHAGVPPTVFDQAAPTDTTTE
ncbi:DUF4192 domain-containing protein [Micromonospora sp. NPDC050495]|uniref:DUF4192 domain-containing protein n=1 Tax=Micromonospora sp. NPDC050495 TaxID=3154936 RepID=UPI00340E34EB